MQLPGRCVLVTGAGSGLGRATAEYLHAGGANIVLLDTDELELEALVTKLGDRARASRADVRDETQVGTAIGLARSEFGQIDVAINCAGVASSAKLVSRGEPHALDVWRRVIDINLTGTFNVMRLAAAQMAGNAPNGETGERGVVINTASIAAFDGQRGQAAYAASKSGVIGMTLPAARDLADHAIRCVAIAPGLFETPLLSGIPEKGVDALKRSLLYPARMGSPSEFASLVLHIIQNPYLNGECLRLDGGARLSA